jgi:putative transposase
LDIQQRLIGALILNAIFYIHRSGCQWEMWPHDLPAHTTVYKYFQKWERKGIWKQIHDQLRHKLRTQMGRAEKSTVAMADSQSVETTEKRGRSTALTVVNLSRDASATL